MDVVSQIKSTISTNQIIAIFSTMLIPNLLALPSDVTAKSSSCSELKL